MSKERALRRAEREREAAIKAAARAAEAERRERREARARAVRAATTGRLARSPRRHVGRPSGTLGRRRRNQALGLCAALALLNVLVWIAAPSWVARLGALVVSVLVFPVLRTLLFPR